MALTATGSDVALVRNARTGRYDLDFETSGSSKGNPKFDDTETHRVMSLLVEHQGEWWADETGKRGSRLHTVKEIRRTAVSDLENFALEALQPAIDAKKILEVKVEARRLSPTRIDLFVTWKTQTGKPASTRRTIGV